MSILEHSIDRLIGNTGSVPVLQAAERTTLHLDKAALRESGLLPPESQERLLAGQYRQIKRPLIANAKGNGAPLTGISHVIMIASALPGEGKTFTSINLAMSMAREKDIEVLLVDADVAKPHISKVFGVEHEPGLLECLEDETLDPESIVMPTDVPGLSFLPAGKPTDTATELLASVRMQRVIGELSRVSSRRLVLLDSPPLLLTSESRVLAGLVGQIVLVVRAGSTPQRAVLDAVSHLAEETWVGVVLNQSESNREDRYYYGYGYGYGYGSTNEKGGRDEAKPVSP